MLIMRSANKCPELLYCYIVILDDIFCYIRRKQDSENKCVKKKGSLYI